MADKSTENAATEGERETDAQEDHQDASNEVSGGAGVIQNTSPRTSTHDLTLTIPMPSPDLSLHSPTQIVGTPFALGSPKFEYPFPAEGSSSIPAPISLPNNNLSLDFPVPTTFPPPNPRYSPTHPKLRAVAPNVPVPPGLVKKKHRWSFGLLGRRKSSNTSAEGSSPTGENPLVEEDTDKPSVQ